MVARCPSHGRAVPPTSTVPMINPSSGQAASIIAIVLAITILPPLATAADPPTGLSVGIVRSLLGDASPAVVRVAGRPIRDILATRDGLAGEFSTASDATALAARMKAGECQLGVFPGYEFAWVANRDSELVALAVAVPPSGQPRVVVVVHRDAAVRVAGDLMAGGVAIPAGTRGHVQAYLAKLGAGLAGPVKSAPQSAADALDAVVAGTSSAAAMDVAALAGYETLQPGAVKRLRVLVRSDPFPQNVIAYRKGGLGEAEAERVRKAMVGAEKMAAGKRLFLLWGIKEFAAPPTDYAQQLTTSFKVYPPQVAP